jgi:hypothetical protein
MSTRRTGRRRKFERVTTRDAVVPLSADDPQMENGWRCVPIQPTADDDWFIIDDSRDRKTVWGRWRAADGAEG